MGNGESTEDELREEELKILVARTYKILKRAKDTALSREEARKMIGQELKKAIFSQEFREYLFGLIDMRTSDLIDKIPARIIIKKVHIPVRERTHYIPPINEETMLKYVNDGLTDFEIAQKEGITQEAVRKNRRYFYISKSEFRKSFRKPKLLSKPKVDRETMLKYVNDGLTDFEIAQKEGMTYYGVKELRKKYLIQKRRYKVNLEELKEVKKMYEMRVPIRKIEEKFNTPWATLFCRLQIYYPDMVFRGRGKSGIEQEEKFINLIKEKPLRNEELKQMDIPNPCSVYRRLVIKGWAIRRLATKDGIVYYIEQMKDKALEMLMVK